MTYSSEVLSRVGILRALSTLLVLSSTLLVPDIARAADPGDLKIKNEVAASTLDGGPDDLDGAVDGVLTFTKLKIEKDGVLVLDQPTLRIQVAEKLELKKDGCILSSPALLGPPSLFIECREFKAKDDSQVVVQGPLAGGFLSICAEKGVKVEKHSFLSVDGIAGPAGDLVVRAGRKIEIKDKNSAVTASGSIGGVIDLRSCALQGDGIKVKGSVLATGSAGVGGVIELLATQAKIKLSGRDVELNASGTAGDGTIAVIAGTTIDVASQAVIAPVPSLSPLTPSTVNCECELLALSIASGADLVTIVQGESQNVVSVVQLGNTSGLLANVVATMEIEPLSGLTITDDYPSSGYFSSDSTDFVLNQAFAGAAVGTYLVTNTVSIAGTSLTSTDTITVEVLPPGGDPVVLPLGSHPDGVQVGVVTPVLFTVAIANHFEAPLMLTLHDADDPAQPMLVTLLDDGTGGDLAAEDGIYSGMLTITAAAEGSSSFLARGVFPGVTDPRESAVHVLPASPFPAHFALSDMTTVVMDPASQQEMLCGEVLVTFENPMSSSEVMSFANGFAAQVVGMLPGLGIYQLAVPNPSCTSTVLLATVNSMQADPLVASAVPNAIGEIFEYSPNDTSYGSQYAPQQMRADEAWVIARGGPMIAIVDTGVDHDHEDLTGKVVLGPDLVNGDADPDDDQGHGTHCAGIAAASGDNNKGIAGISWGSKILAVKVADAGGSITFANGVAGIKASADLGAKVISCSWGYKPTVLNTVLAWFHGLESAVNYATAKGALVVVAAGNESSTAIRLPARYGAAFCVGSTNQSDGRSGFSNFGAQCDIAAPGSSILSCQNGGGYVTLGGTSMATPAVAGCAAVVWSYFPSWSQGQIRARLQATAEPLPGLQLGSGRCDLFEAVFNGSFEDGTRGWKSVGTSGAVPSLGPIMPTARENMGFISSGPASTQIESSIEQSFTIQAGVTSFDLTFDYDFVTEEYPEFVGTAFNDNMRIVLISPGGNEVELAYEDVNTSSFSVIGGIDFPGGDDTTGHTGWKTVTMSVPVTQGPGTYRLRVRDEGDGIYDSNLMIDNIMFK